MSERSLLCCVNSADDVVVVREAARLAAAEGLVWRAIHVDTGIGEKRDPLTRQSLVETLQIAVQLGASVVVLQDRDVYSALNGYAHEHGVKRVVLGAPRRRRILRRNLVSRLSRGSAFDLVLVRRSAATSQMPVVVPRRTGAWTSLWKSTLTVTAALAVISVIELIQLVDAVSLAMMMVLSVAFVAMRVGRRAAGVTILGNLAIFDFLVVPPRFAFALENTRYLTTFGVMLAVGLLVGELTARLRHQARVAAAGEQRAYALAAFSRDLLAQVSIAEVEKTAARTIEDSFRAKVLLLWPGPDDTLLPPAQGTLPPDVLALARRAFREGQRLSQKGRPSQLAWVVVPLSTALRARGVLAVEPRDPVFLSQPEHLRELDTFAALIALALERVHYVQIAQEALVGIESERLRNSLLAALSHDLRTPLSGVIGLAESILLSKPEVPEAQRASLLAIVEEGQRMASSVDNLLQMARLQTGTISLRRDWHSIEEVIGGALAASRRRLGRRELSVDVEHDLPLVELDAALIERVLVNLLDNAAKYTLADAKVWIAARVLDAMLQIEVIDNGPGIAPGSEEIVFAKFARARPEAAGSGLGLGLSICRAIVQAHGGQIEAESRRRSGTRIIIRLPLTEAPQILTETDPFAQHV